jgi:hypothetical protein
VWRGSGVVFFGVVVAVDADGGKAELVTGRRGRPSLGRLGRQCGHDLSPESGVAREDPKIPQQMQSRRGHRCDQAGQEVERFEHECAGAVSPDFLELELEASVVAGSAALGQEADA